MHVDEVATNNSLVSRLLADQFPHWADLPIKPVPSAGTDNALYRLGDGMVVRTPRIHWAVGQVEKEHHWLPRLAPFLPLAIPVPVAMGDPGQGYPWKWSIYTWIEGENAVSKHIADPHQAALDLAHFIAALQQIDSSDGPPPDQYNAFRGVPLATRDAETRQALLSLDGMIDTKTAVSAWESSLQASTWQGPPIWLHGDLQSGNLLAVQGRLRAVIDFGCFGIGDPACDVMAAWLYLTTGTRGAFRAVLQVDEATWRRARGWALSVSLIALPYYRHTNPVLADISRRAITETLTDFRLNG